MPSDDNRSLNGDASGTRAVNFHPQPRSASTTARNEFSPPLIDPNSNVTRTRPVVSDGSLFNRPGFTTREQACEIAFLLLLFGVGDLSVDHVIVCVTLDATEHADRFREFGVPHP